MNPRPKIKLIKGQMVGELHETDPVYLFMDGTNNWVMIPAEGFLTGKPMLIQPVGSLPSGFKEPN